MIVRPKNKRAARKAFWSALGRLLSVILGAGSGSILYHTIGVTGTTMALGTAFMFAVVGFILMWFTEYEKENGGDD